MKPRIPREGTRARAVFDELVAAYRMGIPHTATWTGLKDSYDDNPPEYPLRHRDAPAKNPRRYSGMNVRRILQKYADRVGKGEYLLKVEYIPEDAIVTPKPSTDEKQRVAYAHARLNELERMVDDANVILEKLAIHDHETKKMIADMFAHRSDLLRQIKDLNQMKFN